MFQNELDLGGNDLVWRNKPELPAANEENKRLEETLKLKKIEIERLKLAIKNNITKGKNMQEHFNMLCQNLNYKQQLYKSKEHELESEIHAEKVMDRECSRHESEIKVLNQEIKSLKKRQDQRQAAIDEQTEKCKKLRSTIQCDEETLLNYLERSAQVEQDNMALMKYASEDDSKLNELGLNIERLSKEVYERKSALDDADTEVFIVQSELDKMQDEFRNEYAERNNLIANWEKVMNQTNQRNAEIHQLSESILKMRDEEKKLRREEKEQLQLLKSETTRNNNLELEIKTRDSFATKLHNAVKDAHTRQEDLEAELATSKNVSSNLLYQKQVVENTLNQIDKQMEQKNQKIESVTNSCKKLEQEIDVLEKETFEADHYIKELENVLQKENRRNAEVQRDLETVSKEILAYALELKNLQDDEKNIENLTKNCQADIRNADVKITAVDILRGKLESEMYELDLKFEKLQKRIKKMVGITNEQEKRLIETQRSQLLSTLEEKKKSLTMLTEELKIMMEKINVSIKELGVNKKLNSELDDKIKSLDFYLTNSEKALTCSTSRKEEMLVKESLIKFLLKRYKKLLKNRNKSVFTLQKSKAEFEALMKERMEELKNCNELLEAEIRSEEDEYSLIKRKLFESDDKLQKLKSKYEVIMDALGVSEPGESAEAELLIKAEEEKRDMQYERDQLLSNVLKNEEELSALKNTLWMIDAANEQFRQVVYPAGISLEDSEALRNTEEESQATAIKLHIRKGELQTLEEAIKSKKEELSRRQSECEELRDIIADREAENEALLKEIEDVDTKIQRADRNNSKLNVDLKKCDGYSGIEEDIRIHLLREIRRNVSDLLFAAVESKPEVSAKIQQLFEEAQIPLPTRARSSLSSRSGSMASLYSRISSKPPSPKVRSEASSRASSRLSSRTDIISPSVVSIGDFPPGLSEMNKEM